MLKRALMATALALVLVALAVPSAEASPPSNTWCSNVCGPGVPCSTQCWVYSLLEGRWYRVDCTAYDSLFGGGSCGPVTGAPAGDLDLDRFLTSLESLAENDDVVVIR